MLAKVCLKLECNQYYIDSERNPTGGIVGRTPNNERRYVNMAVTGIGTYSSYTNSYGNTQNAGNKTGRTYKNAHEYKNYLTQKYDCLRSRDYSVNINSSLLSKAMGDEKTKQWLEYNLSLIPESIEKLKAAQNARGCKVLSVTDTINGYDSITEEVLVTDEVDPGTEKARKELEERLEKRKAEKKETEERLEKQRAEKQDQEERQYNLKIDGKDVADLTGKMVEKMKVCTCLNPLHTALAIYGCLLGYDKISEEMKDDDLRKMIEIIGYKEGLPVVVNPGILDPKKFIKTVLEVRLPNPFMPDTPQRIATDTSQKLAIRFGETIKAYMASDELEASDLKLIPLVFAGWLRYLMAVDDNGNAFEPSSDPMLAELTPYLKDIKWNDEQAEKKILPILAKSEIFGVNLAEAGLLCRVVKYFKELIAGVGAVRTTLHKYVSNN